MSNVLLKKSWCLAVILLLITMSTISIPAIENKKDISPQTTLEYSENILAYITVEWESFFSGWNLSDLPPNVTINQSDTREFHFQEINGIIQMNFTVVCKQKLLNRTLFPRFARFDLVLKHNNTHIYNDINSFFCNELIWKYGNIIVGRNDTINDLVTNGQNATLIPTVGTRTFPTLFLFLTGIYEELEPITVVPIPTPP